MRTWQIHEESARVSELVESAQEQPQDITVQGKSVAVVVSRDTFDRLSLPQGSLVDFMRRSPLFDAKDISFERENDD